MIEAIENKLSEILKDKKNLSNMIEENQRKKEQLQKKDKKILNFHL